MATGTAGNTAHSNRLQTISYLRKSVVFNADATPTTITVGRLPIGATIMYTISGVMVDTAFNDGTANTLDIGVSGTTQKYASALALGTVAFVPLDVSAVSHTLSASEEIIATLTQTGGDATTGAGEIIIAFLCDNDG
jgi:hypothetical protein